MTKRSSKTLSLDLIVIETEPRIDSRLMVDRLGIQHESFIRMIRKHEAEFSSSDLTFTFCSPTFSYQR